MHKMNNTHTDICTSIGDVFPTPYGNFKHIISALVFKQYNMSINVIRKQVLVKT